MRFVAAIALSATWLFLSHECDAQSFCSAHPTSSKAAERLPTTAEMIHNLLQTPPQRQPFLVPQDVEFVLRCGTPHEAAELFANVRYAAVEMHGAIVVEATRYTVSVSWAEGLGPNVADFTFEWAKPMSAPPHPGEKIVVSGRYSSYNQEPFEIRLTNSSFVPLPPGQ